MAIAKIESLSESKSKVLKIANLDDVIRKLIDKTMASNKKEKILQQIPR